MSSLVTSASIWISSEPPKRRPSTMRKTIKKKPLQEDSMTEPNYNKLKPSTFEDMQNLSNEHTSRVNDLLNEISTTTIDESNQLADFEPLGPPDIQSKLADIFHCGTTTSIQKCRHWHRPCYNAHALYLKQTDAIHRRPY